MPPTLREAVEAAVENTEVADDSTPSEVVEAAAPAESVVDSNVDNSSPPAVAEEGITDGASNETKPKSIDEVVAGDETKPAEKDHQPVKPTGDPRIDRAPASWKGDAKKLWAELPLAARQEVVRRERDTMRVLQDSSQDRAKIATISETFAAHRERIDRMYGGDPIAAVQSLLRAEHSLTSAAPQERAQFVANMIKQYGVDIQMLDSCLAGESVAPTESSRIEELLNRRLAPVEQMIRGQQQAAQQSMREVQQQAQHTVEEMSADVTNFPYFDDVRDDIADIIEMGVKRGQSISLQDAYSKAVRLNDTTFQANAARQAASKTAQTALAAHTSAQKAMGAAVSVSGSPSGTGANLGNPTDLRSTIASAMDSVGGRL